MSQSMQTVSVYRCRDLTVTHGVNLGDPISFAEELIMEDVFGLSLNAQLMPLALELTQADTSKPTFSIAADSALGTQGATVVLDSTVTFMLSDSTTIEALILVEVIDGGVEEVYVLPLSQLAPKQEYTLVGIDRDTPLSRLTELGAVAFLRGTHITLATGEQRLIEDLRVGDRVLTRDAGAQELRWIGAATTRAVGAFAPILIRKGVLNNLNDLRVSPDHRLFVYQRRDELRTGRAEVLVRARYLVNGDSVVQEEGGFVEYFQLLFDRHQIIFAEGIAAETLQMTQHLQKSLPPDLANTVPLAGEDPAALAHLTFEISEGMLTGDTVNLLRRATSRSDS